MTFSVHYQICRNGDFPRLVGGIPCPLVEGMIVEAETENEAIKIANQRISHHPMLTDYEGGRVSFFHICPKEVQ